jgi:hypothetical protein
MRQFIRHPANIPIEVAGDEPASPANLHAQNISLGGLSFQSRAELEPGAIVAVKISWVRPEFETKARVVWCNACDEAFDLGVEFLDAEDAFRARMVEQVCHIENNRQEIRRVEGRALTAEEAAVEWIAKYASQFPEIGPEGGH